MARFSTDFQIIPAAAIYAGIAVQPAVALDILSVLPNRFCVSTDTAALIAGLVPVSAPWRLAA